ncbi:MAG TPA: 5-formyltetrahydrofolate cyclo-ligase [Holosporales bacterium]|nr:5-formyltetrahydrofolate cyclo-ligase [Holosporales bacterium]
MTNKANLRQRAKAVRGRFFSTQSSSDLLRLEEKRVSALWDLPLFQSVLKQEKESFVGVYSALRDEASTNLLLNHLSEQGCSMALPRLTQEGEMHFHSWSQGTSLIKSPLGILEPASNSAIVIPHLCIVPLLAFDEKKGRMGYGQGYYDRYFAKHPSIIKIGWAYECQKFDALITEDHDVPLDEVIYEN